MHTTSGGKTTEGEGPEKKPLTLSQIGEAIGRQKGEGRGGCILAMIKDLYPQYNRKGKKKLCWAYDKS